MDGMCAGCGGDGQEHFELARAAGMTDYVAKPYDKKALIELILRTLASD